MTETYFPFDSGAGANVTESQWRKMGRMWGKNGVGIDYLNELEVYADSTGMQVKVKSGRAWVEGAYYESDAERTLAIATAHATLDRIDVVVLEFDYTTKIGTTKVVTGTAAASPVRPALQQDSSKWQFLLAEVFVDDAVVTIAASKVTDYREWDTEYGAFEIGFGDGYSVIPTGVIFDMVIPDTVRLYRWTLIGDASGSIVVDLWYDSFENGNPTVADTITASAKPTLSAAQSGRSSVLTGWTKNLAKGYRLRGNVDSVTTIKKCLLVLEFIKRRGPY